MNRGLSEEALASASASVEEVLGRRGAPSPAALAAETAVVLDALSAAATEGATEIDRNEALALASLLGRRLALAGASTPAALAALDMLEQTRPRSGPCDAAWGQQALRVALLDGYTLGLREAVEAEAEARIGSLAEALPLGGGLVLALPPPIADEGRASAASDALGRALLRLDAKACVIWVRAGATGAEGPLLEATLQLAEHARMIGAKLAVAVPDPALRAELIRRLDPAVPVSSELAPALGALGFAVRESGALWRWLG